MRRIIFNLHLCGALIAGLFIVILGATGSIMAFEDDLDRIFHPGLFQVKPGAQPLPITAIQDSLKAAYSGQRFPYLHVPSRPDETYYTQARGMQIFIDGYTGRIVGTRTTPTLLSRIHQLHLRLLIGKTGDTVVSCAAIVLVFLVCSGIYLWWPLKRVTVNFRASLRRISFDLHNVAGAYSAVFLLVLSLTGIAIGFDEEIFPWVYRITNSAPPSKNFPSTLQKGVKPIPPDEAVRAAHEALPGAAAIAVQAPAGARGSYVVAMRFPEDLTPGGRSWVNVDQYSGKPLFVGNSRTAPAGTRIVIANRAIHTGDIFGYPTKILMSVSSLMLVIQAITGYYMWWKKQRRGQSELESEQATESAA